MIERWTIALGAATLVALVVTPWLARRTPPARRRQRSRASLATSAAPLLALAVPAAIALLDLEPETGVALVAALWLWWAGLLAEQGHLPQVLRQFGLGVSAVVVTAAGLRIEATGVTWADMVLTVAVVWITASAWRSAVTRDGLLLGWTATVAGGAALVGGLAGQNDVLILGAGTAGAALGFLPYVVPPLAARLRAPAAGLLGFLAVDLAIAAKPAVPVPETLVPTLLLVAVPLIDGAMAGLAKLRGRGDDPRTLGLAGRWRALGATRALTSFVLVLVQGVLAFVALCAARGVLSTATAAALGGGLLILLVVPALLVRLDAPPGRWPRLVLILIGLAVAALAVLAVPAGVAVWRARASTNEAADAARRGLAAVREGKAKAAAKQFGIAERAFAEAERRLHDPFASFGLTVPVLAPNLRAARALTSIGADLAQTGRELSTTANPQKLKVVNATLNLDELRRLEPDLAAAARRLTSAAHRIHRIDDTFLIPQVRDAIDTLQRRLNRAANEGRTAAIAAKVLPDVFGGNGERRYFLALQNNAEARATGGFIGTWGDITALNGRLDLGDLHRVRLLDPQSPDEPRVLNAPDDYIRRYSRFAPERTWENVNFSPDVPTVGQVEAALLPQSGFGSADGIVTVDPFGLAAILNLTGPIQVAEWPDPITADNVVDITLHDAYIRFATDNQARDEFLGNVAHATWDAFSERDLGSPATVLRSLSKATRGKHLTLWFRRPAEQALALRAHSAGQVPRSVSDMTLTTTQNTAGNKIDFYLHRTVRYDLTLSPDRNPRKAVAEGRLEVKLVNMAPASGLPPYIIGPYSSEYSAGENRTFLSVYSPLRLQQATLDGATFGMEAQRELGSWAYSNYLSLAAKSRHTLALHLSGHVRLERGGWYELALVRQPTITPDEVSVRLRAPSGWRFAEGDGLHLRMNGREAVRSGRLTQDTVVRVRLVADSGDDLWSRLERGPA